MTLNKENTKIWLKALRSGEYEQGRGYLCATRCGVDEFCCLGVAADVLFDGDWEDGSIKTVWSVDRRETRLPQIVRDMIGLSLEQQSELITLNDGCNADFDGIADIIEGWLNDEA